MDILCVTLWFILQVSYVESDHGERQGVLLFMEAGSAISFSDLWNDKSLSDTTNLDRHQNTKYQFFQNRTFFRSPLIDRLGELNVTMLEMLILNAEGGYMGSYIFTGMKDANFLDSSFMFSFENDEDINSDYPDGPFVNIYSSQHHDLFSFMSIHMKSGLADLHGEQFIVSTNDTFGGLASAEYDDCYMVSSGMDYIVVTSVYECTLHCLTVTGCNHTGIYTVHITTQNSSITEIRCVVFTSVTVPTTTSALCGDTTCPDGNICGEFIASPIPSDISVNVYSVALQLEQELQDMKPNVNSLSTTKITKLISIDLTIDMEDPIFINGFSVVGGKGLFQVATWIDDCNGVLTDPLFHEDTDYYLTDAGGEIRTFDSANYISPISPTKFRCMYFNSSGSFYDLTVNFHVVTNEFQLAQYVAILGVWRNEECNLTDIMTRSDIIQDSSISLDVDTVDFDFSNSKRIATPLEYKLVIDLFPIAPLDTSIENILIKTSEDVRMIMTIVTADLYETQIKEATISGNLGLHDETFLSAVHAENVTIKLSALSIEPYSTIKTFDIGLEVIGCTANITINGQCIRQNMLDKEGLILVKAKRALRKSVAYEVLGPHGTGLSIIDSNTITIRIPFHLMIQITHVIISGEFKSAVVEIDNVPKYGTLDTEAGTIEYRFDRVVGYYVYIENVTRPSGASYVFPKITVQILACEVPTMSPVKTDQMASTIYNSNSPSIGISPSVSVSAFNSEEKTFSSLGLSSDMLSSSSVTIESSFILSPVSSLMSTDVLISPGPTEPVTMPITPTLSSSMALSMVTASPTMAPHSSNIVASSPSAMFSSSFSTNAHDMGITKQPPPVCLCGNINLFNTTDELEEFVKKIQKKLSVPPKSTAAFKRTKVSAPDERTSSKVIGAVGVASMTLVGVMMIAMDAGHIINAFHFIKALLPL